jgi:hypothetical protein
VVAARRHSPTAPTRRHMSCHRFSTQKPRRCLVPLVHSGSGTRDGQHAARRSRSPTGQDPATQITDSGAPRPTLELRQTAVPEEAPGVNSLRRSRRPLSLPFAGSGVVWGRAWWAPQPKSGREVGGAVKAGPSGLPGGEALTAPGAGCRQPQWGMEPGQGFLVASLWVDTAVTSPLAPRAGRGRPWGSAAGHSFVPTVRGAWCVLATARRAALSSSASPEGGHGDLRARALAVSEPCSTGLPD